MEEGLEASPLRHVHPTVRINSTLDSPLQIFQRNVRSAHVSRNQGTFRSRVLNAGEHGYAVELGTPTSMLEDFPLHHKSRMAPASRKGPTSFETPLQGYATPKQGTNCTP